MSQLVSNKLKSVILETPVVLIVNLKASLYHQFGIKSYSFISNILTSKGISNFHILPILTARDTYLKNRILQVKDKIEQICDQHESKVHVICYSFANLPLHGFISDYNGDNFIKSVLFLSSPNRYN